MQKINYDSKSYGDIKNILLMNLFLKESIEYAQQRTYLDDLYSIYPTINNSIRDIDKELWKKVEASYNGKDNAELIRNMLKLKLFPIKSSYVAFLRKDKDAIRRNPKTVNRLAAELRGMSLSDIYEKCSQPKEANRQIGPMFRSWVKRTEWGFPKMNYDEFCDSNKDAICIGTDQEMQEFASKNLHYDHDKGLDFLARINGRYVIGEAKFITDNGGHQMTQFNDAIATVESRINAVRVAILDGVLYIKSKNKMYKGITEVYSEDNIMSALLLRDFLYTI